MSKPFKLLVVEDDQFQRLALIDILTLCDYEVECGSAALEELNKPENEFDLVLLDLILPDIDGMEVLKTMKKNPKNVDLPVVMMSANEGTEIIASCIEFGAKDYLVKPLRINVVKGLKPKYMNKELTNGPQMKVKEQVNLTNYEKEKELGRGAAGSVWLVKKKSEPNQRYAMKMIPLSFLKDQQEKKQAQNEVTLLKLLLGPTIVRYFDSFSDSENLYIIMEYAEGGNLSDKVKQQSMINKPFTKDVIMKWVAQITIALMLMHNKKVLHRDIKSQNMFLTKDNTVKIGDFGISKEMSTFQDMAKTSCGTPYFMCPEVCKGQPYDQKADIWSFGCLIYELATFKKPFDGENVQAVWEQIVNKPFSPLPNYVDAGIKFLILQLLNKDPTKRPDIWEVAQIPCVKEAIDKFCEEIKFTELPSQTHMNKSKKEEHKEEEVKTDTSKVDIDKLDEYASILRQELNPRTVKTGWFATVDNCVSGKDICNYFIEKMNYEEEECIEIGQKFLDKSLIHCVSKKTTFEDSDSIYYIFQTDRKDVPLNMGIVYNGDPRNALVISAELASVMNDILKQHYGFNEAENDYVINFDEIQKSEIYTKYLQTASELQSCNLHSLKKKESILFFVNVYQSMLAHAVISSVIKSGEKSKGIFGKVKSYLGTKEKIIYSIAKMNFTLEEIKHGVLRGNRKPPGALMRLLGSNDLKLQHSNQGKFDPNILLICADYPNIPTEVHCFKDADSFDKQLSEIATEILSDAVLYNDDSGELTLPTVIDKYKSDFGDDDAARISKIWKYCNSDCSVDKVLKNLKKGNLFIRYSDETQEES